MIDVLCVASEIFPLVKTGGLADVVGALPNAVGGQGVQMRTLVPGYPAVLSAMKSSQKVADIPDLFGGPAQLLAGQSAGLDIIAIDAPHLYDREGGPYALPSGVDFDDNWKRFAALSWVGAEMARGLVEGYKPDILHAHDWQAGLVAAYVRFGTPCDVKTVFTVHNLAFQGQVAQKLFGELRLPPKAFSVDGVEYYGDVGYLKAGLQCSDVLTTVSPSYALEIRSAEFGMGLEGLLNERAMDLHGILNGIDPEIWNPDTDVNLEANFHLDSVGLRKQNKIMLEKRFSLDAGKGPLFSVVSRLTWQKGIDLLAQSIDGLVAQGARLCVLGSGDKELEDAIADAVIRHPGKVGFVRGYDEPLSHLIQGGADAILLPSRFEPCGLTQMFGLRYGCVPVVARVGGLADTVIDANSAALEAGVATGVQFYPVTKTALDEAITRAIRLFSKPKSWGRLQRRGMKADVSWDVSAKRYAALYKELLGRK